MVKATALLKGFLPIFTIAVVSEAADLSKFLCTKKILCDWTPVTHVFKSPKFNNLAEFHKHFAVEARFELSVSDS